jgi:predicted nucleotidyltransferase
MNDLTQLAERVDASERTLRRAVAAGTLRGERSSPRRLKLSAAERDYVLRRWHLLAQLRAALRTEPNVRFALLFGSGARGEDTATSDIDLVVEMRRDSLADLIDLELKLGALLGRDVDLLSLADVEANSLLFAEAFSEGRVIVDREGRWPELRSRAPDSRRRARNQARARGQRALAGIEELTT